MASVLWLACAVVGKLMDNAVQDWWFMKHIELQQDNYRAMQRAFSVTLQSTLPRSREETLALLLDAHRPIGLSVNHSRAGAYIARLAGYKAASGVPTQLRRSCEEVCDRCEGCDSYAQSDDECEETCSHCERCQEDEDEELPLPTCYMPRGEGTPYDPDKHMWEFRVSAYLVGNYSLASAYPQNLFLSVQPVDDHGPYKIILGARAFIPATWNLARVTPSIQQALQLSKTVHRAMSRSRDWRLVFDPSAISALHYQRCLDELPLWLDDGAGDPVEASANKGEYVCGNEDFEGQPAGLLVIEASRAPTVQHKRALHGFGSFEDAADFTRGAIKHARRYYVVAPSGSLEMFLTSLQAQHPWAESMLQEGIEGGLVDATYLREDEHCPPAPPWDDHWQASAGGTGAAASRVARLDNRSQFDAFVQAQEQSIVYLYLPDHDGEGHNHPAHSRHGQLFFRVSDGARHLPFGAVNCAENSKFCYSVSKYLPEMIHVSQLPTGLCQQTSGTWCKRYVPQTPPHCAFSAECCGVKSVEHVQTFSRAQVETGVYLEDGSNYSYPAASIGRALHTTQDCRHDQPSPPAVSAYLVQPKRGSDGCTSYRIPASCSQQPCAVLVPVGGCDLRVKMEVALKSHATALIVVIR